MEYNFRQLAHKRIIIVDNKPIGVYDVHTTEDGDLFINEISIAKVYQSKGIGRKILEISYNTIIKMVLEIYCKYLWIVQLKGYMSN